jgi:2-polyprenyl-3-methyl-5-hydroxy-6-metoxy-1,4-benzoquinol methylase
MKSSNSLSTTRYTLRNRLKYVLRGVRNSIRLVPIVLTSKKPEAVSWRDFIFIQLAQTRYQPLIFPNGEVVLKRCSESILDSRDKLAVLDLPDDLTGKTLLDVGCAEGFFVIQAALRNAERAIGCDILPSRLNIARVVAKSWHVQDRVLFSQTELYDIPPEWASDIVFCFSVAHHLHDGFHDTWRIISSPQKYAKYFDNMMKAVATVSSLTKEVTYWEYAFEYSDHKPDEVDHTALGQLWIQHGLYKRVDFLGLSQTLPVKDRALYRAYK